MKETFQNKRSDRLRQSKPRGLLFLASSLLSLLVIGAIVAASIGQVDVVVVARGNLTTKQPAVALGPVSNSVVDELLVLSGDEVKKGQVLVRFKDKDLKAHREAKQKQLNRLKAHETALKYLLQSSVKPLPQFSSDPTIHIAEKNWVQAVSKKLQSLKNSELARQKNYDYMQTFHTDKVTLLDQLQKLSKETAVTHEKLYQKEKSAFQREGPRKLLMLSSQAHQFSDELQSLTNQRADHQNNLEYSLFQSSLHGALADITRELEKELYQVSMQLTSLIEEVRSIDYRLRHTEILAPQDGYILETAKVTHGSVVSSGQAVLKFSPLTEDYFIKAYIDPKDISLVKPEDKVAVKLDALPFTRHGTLDGVIHHISEGLVQVPQDNSRMAYAAEIKIQKSHLHHQPESFRYLPGLGAQLDVHVGKRSFMSYLIEPVNTAFKESFREP